ncbi:MAG: DNA-processing protein DprA [Paracoccaceae bacterium]
MDTVSPLYPVVPPNHEGDLIAWLRLARSRRVGATTFFRLMGEHGSADAALEALPGIAAAAGEDEYAPFTADQAERELAAGRAVGARLIACGSDDYPGALAEIPNPPPVIWVRGKTHLLHRPMVALVGARNASSLGMRMARRLAAGLGEHGFTCVSGLARGVDTAAHMASLDSGTVAVLAGGIDIVYPAENTGLAEQIGTHGVLVSEQPPGLHPRARHFPQRNRIISGLSHAVLVVEAAARSGSLITAREALDQGREVMAVPGHPFDARAGGCNMLIRDGATLVRGAEDVIEDLCGDGELHFPLPLPKKDSPGNAPLVEREHSAPLPCEAEALKAEILNRLGPSPVAEDQLIRDLGAPIKKVTPVLMELELTGQIRRQAGGLLSLA